MLIFYIFLICLLVLIIVIHPHVLLLFMFMLILAKFLIAFKVIIIPIQKIFGYYSCTQCVGNSRWWGSLTMVPACTKNSWRSFNLQNLTTGTLRTSFPFSLSGIKKKSGLLKIWFSKIVRLHFLVMISLLMIKPSVLLW